MLRKSPPRAREKAGGSKSPAHDLELLTSSQVADILHIQVQTLADWRCKGHGLPYVRVGRCIRYDPRDVRAWLDANKVSMKEGAA